MCLKEIHVFTFTNREALGRLVARLHKDYGYKVPKGVFFKVTGIPNNPPVNMSGYTEYRPKFDYEQLSGLLEFSCINVEIFEFKTWKEFHSAIIKTKIGDDIFGLVKVEIR